MNRTLIKIIGRVGFVFVVLLCLVGILSVVTRFISTMSVLAGQQPAPDAFREFDSRYWDHPWLTLAHIVPGFIFMTIGPLQFVAAIRNRFLRFHRACGYVYLAASLVGVTSALLFLPWLPVFGGFTVKAAVTMGALLFLLSIVMGYVRIRQRQIQKHREWMIRGFAIGLGISTFRVLIPILMSPLFKLSFPEAWDTVAWLGFAINLLVAEVWINITRSVAAAPSRSAVPRPMATSKVVDAPAVV